MVWNGSPMLWSLIWLNYYPKTSRYCCLLPFIAVMPQCWIDGSMPHGLNFNVTGLAGSPRQTYIRSYVRINIHYDAGYQGRNRFLGSEYWNSTTTSYIYQHVFTVVPADQRGVQKGCLWFGEYYRVCRALKIDIARILSYLKIAATFLL